jgi:hypothetical protein
MWKPKCQGFCQIWIHCKQPQSYLLCGSGHRLPQCRSVTKEPAKSSTEGDSVWGPRYSPATALSPDSSLLRQLQHELPSPRSQHTTETSNRSSSDRDTITKWWQLYGRQKQDKCFDLVKKAVMKKYQLPFLLRSAQFTPINTTDLSSPPTRGTKAKNKASVCCTSQCGQRPR